MIKIDLSIEALLARRELAEKAAKRMPFEVARIVLCMGEEEREGNHKDEDDFFTSNDSNTVIATIDELLRLREDNERLEKEADWLALKAWKKRDSEYLPEREHECLECPFDHDCVKCWREAARRAVEKEVC